jgi:hypothetical protein
MSDAAKAEAIHRQVSRLKRYSDRLVGIGPFGVGLDGLLAFIPVAGTVYSAGAGAWLVAQAMRGGASPLTVARMVAYLGFDTATSTAPILGSAVDFLFPGHLMAATALLKDIEKRHPHLKAASAKEQRRTRTGWSGRQPGASHERPSPSRP